MPTGDASPKSRQRREPETSCHINRSLRSLVDMPTLRLVVRAILTAPQPLYVYQQALRILNAFLETNQKSYCLPAIYDAVVVT